VERTLVTWATNLHLSENRWAIGGSTQVGVDASIESDSKTSTLWTAEVRDASVYINYPTIPVPLIRQRKKTICNNGAKVTPSARYTSKRIRLTIKVHMSGGVKVFLLYQRLRALAPRE